MGARIYEDRVEERDDPWGRPYFWQGGVAVLDKAQPHTDLEAVSEGLVAITPASGFVKPFPAMLIGVAGLITWFMFGVGGQ